MGVVENGKQNVVENGKRNVVENAEEDGHEQDGNEEDDINVSYFYIKNFYNTLYMKMLLTDSINKTNCLKLTKTQALKIELALNLSEYGKMWSINWRSFI